MMNCGVPTPPSNSIQKKTTKKKRQKANPIATPREIVERGRDGGAKGLGAVPAALRSAAPGGFARARHDDQEPKGEQAQPVCGDRSTLQGQAHRASGRDSTVAVRRDVQRTTSRLFLSADEHGLGAP